MFGKNVVEKILCDLDKIQDRIGYCFRNRLLLVQVFFHSSVFNVPIEVEVDGHKELLSSNQRLEFLGDGILSYLVSEYVFLKYPTFSEDYLSSYKSLIVNYYTLYKVCFHLGLQEYLVFNYESLGKNSANLKTFSDTVEALIGAIYLDSGSVFPVKKFFLDVVLGVFYLYLDEIVENIFDWKGFLQGILQKKGLQLPKYKLVDKSHDGFFIIACYDGIEVSSGFGRTKKEAEKQAALNFIKKMRLDQ